VGGLCRPQIPSQMNARLSLGAVLRRTFGIYTEHAHVLLGASVMVEAVLALDRSQLARSPKLAVAALLADLAAMGLFVCAVVLLVADVREGGRLRSARELLRGAWSALGSLLLVGVVAGVTATLLVSVAPAVLVAISASVILGVGVDKEPVIPALLLVPMLTFILVLFLFSELFLFTTWSVLVAVSVLERPGRLRALGRSRELVRGNRWRVLALIFMLALPLVLVGGTIGRVFGDGGSAMAAKLFTATLIAPIPVLAATVLYFELLPSEPSPTSADSGAPGAFPPSTHCPDVT
jgi:hypothetical protein